MTSEEYANGSLSREALEEMLVNGRLQPDTLVWHKSLDKWMPAYKVRSLQLRVIPSLLPPPLPGHEPVQGTPSGIKLVYRSRPWIRWFARMSDYWLCGGIIGAMISVPKDVAVVISMLIIFGWCFIEPIFLSLWGATPGKWFLGISVKDDSGKKLSYGDALERACRIWGKAIWIGIPIVMLIPMVSTLMNFNEHGSAFYDRELGISVRHQPVNLAKVFLLIGLLLIILSMKFW
jgi:uncharacterized RDD family membrane protein YckC